MKRNPKRTVLAGIALTAVVVGAIVAISAIPNHSHKHTGATAGLSNRGTGGDMAVAARYLGTSRAHLRESMRAGRTLAELADAGGGKSAAGLIQALVKARAARLSAAQKSGALSKTLANARRARIDKHAKALVSRRLGAAASELAAAASYLGITQKQLREKQRVGHSLAQIAEATSEKSAAGLIQALVRKRAASITAQLATGRISRDRARTLRSVLQQQVRAEVNRAPSTIPGITMHTTR